MNRLIRPLMGGLFAIALVVGAFALPARADKPIQHTGENPSSVDMNQAWRFAAEQFGTFAAQLLNLTSSGTGAYGGLTIVGQSNMTVTVNPPSGSYGIVLQVTQVDPSPIPIGETPNLPADTTLGLMPFFQVANSSALSVPAPGSNSVYYLVEAQGAFSDGNTASRMFVDSSGNVYNANVATARLQRPAYQVVAGAAAASPTPPPVDAGWLEIGLVKVPTGATNCSVSCVITAGPGTIAAAVVAQCSACVMGQGGSGGTLTFNPTSPITGSAVGSTISAACATCVTNVTASGNLSSSGGTTPNITITSNPTFSSITNNNLAGSGQQFVCTTTAGIDQPCVVGGVSHFPDHGVVVLINAGDGCGSYTPCATSNSVCATGTECGNVQFSSSDQFCMTGYLANYQQTGTGNSGLDTTPNSAGWETGFSQSPQSSISQRAHFYNLTGSSLDFSSGTAHAMLAASYTCLY